MARQPTRNAPGPEPATAARPRRAPRATVPACACGRSWRPTSRPCLDLFEAVAAEGLWLANEPPIDRREVRARWKDLIATGEGTILVAEDEAGPPVGLAAIVGLVAPELGMLVRAGPAPAGDRRRARRGLRRLGARARARARSSCTCSRTTPRAIALYRKHGFEERGVLRRPTRAAAASGGTRSRWCCRSRRLGVLGPRRQRQLHVERARDGVPAVRRDLAEPELPVQRGGRGHLPRQRLEPEGAEPGAPRLVEEREDERAAEPPAAPRRADVEPPPLRDALLEPPERAAPGRLAVREGEEEPPLRRRVAALELGELRLEALEAAGRVDLALVLAEERAGEVPVGGGGGGADREHGGTLPGRAAKVKGPAEGKVETRVDDGGAAASRRASGTPRARSRRAPAGPARSRAPAVTSPK